LRRYAYRIVGYRLSGDAVGESLGTIHATTPRSRVILASSGTVAPSSPADVQVKKTGAGNRIAIKPGSAAKAAVLAYLVFDDNSDQPDSVVWVDSWDVLSSATHDYWTDRTTDANKGYVLRTVDEELNISGPTDVVTPSGGDVLLCLPSPGVIASLDPVATWAGDPFEMKDCVDGDRLTEARLYTPMQMVKDSDGNVYFTDMYPSVVRRIDAASGEVTTIAGTPYVWGYADSIGAAAKFNYVYALGIDDDDGLYVGDQTNHTIRRLSPSGVVTCNCGKPATSLVGTNKNTRAIGCFDGKGIAADIGVSGVSATSWDAGKSLYRRTVTTTAAHGFLTGDYVGLVIDWERMSSTTPGIDGVSEIEVVDANTFYMWYSVPGGNYTLGATPHGMAYLHHTDVLGERSASLLDYVQGITYASDGNVYFTQYGGGVVRRLEADGTVTSIAGHYGGWDYADGTGDEARFNLIGDVVCVRDPGNQPENEYLIIADGYNHVLRKCTLDGVVTTILGGPGTPGDTDGPVSAALLNTPVCLAIADGDLYISESCEDDDYNEVGRVRVVSGADLASGSLAGGTVSTIAGGPPFANYVEDGVLTGAIPGCEGVLPL
jgi:hypothetical protein